jgi:serine/threonine protein kinase
MDQQVIVEALVQVARKRRLLGLGPSQRLGEYAQQKSIQNLDDLRRWLAAGDGLSAHLANQLLTFIPKDDVKPLGGYIPLAHLADGGMGSVWLACSPKNQLVVVKTLKASLPQGLDKSHGTEFMRRFEREARITQQLTHPNIVRCLDSGVSDDRTPFMVLEYVDSGDLKDLVERRGGLNEGLALAILYQVADGLAEANRIHLVHRDIKPPNIFVSSDGRAKLADFGIARSTESNRTMLTMEGAIVGSPLYMSPEQIVTDPNLDVRSDIYALGAVLYYCLAATAPFDGRLQEVLHKHCTASVPDIRKVRPVISEATSQIISTCMQKERGKRFKDPAELRAAIANALVKLGLTPGAPIEEDTRQGDLSSESSDVFKKAADPNLATVATDLRGDPANQMTIATDLRGDPANQMTIAADLRGDPASQMTIAADLLEADAAPAMSASDIHTIAANFLSDDAEAVPSNIPATTRVTHDGSTQATVPMTPLGANAQMLATAVTSAGLRFTAPKLPDKLEGDLSTAIATDWVSLLPATPGEPSAILLFARTRVCLGKLREPPVDVCLRNYPIAVHKEACQRVSRQHLNITYDGIENRCVIEDLKSPNGTMLDGITITGGQSCPLDIGRDNILVVANVMSLWVRCLPRKGERQRELDGAPPSDGSSPCGLDAKHGFDSIIISRPENRPELAYALVLRQLTVGGPGAELVCAGARTRSACQLALFAGRWIWRPAGSEGPWKPLAAGTELDCGGRRLVAQPGSYTHF